MEKAKFFLKTFGCQQNISDSQRIETILRNLNFQKTKKESDADLVILNSCAVKQHAEDRIFGLLEKLQKLRRGRLKLIGITGCTVRKTSGRNFGAKKDPLLRRAKFVDFVFRIEDAPRLGEILNEEEMKATSRDVAFGEKNENENIPPKNHNRNSEFISESKFQNRGEIPNQVRDDKFSPRGDFDLQKLGGVSVSQNLQLATCHLPPFFLSTAGADRPHKNLRNLIRAFAIFDRKNPGAASLVLTGKISPDLKKFIAAQNLPNIFCPGFLPEKKLEKIFRAARAFVFPSRSEGFGIPVLEAQNFSIPIAAASLTALPEIAGAGAVFFDPENPEKIAAKMEKIFFDEKTRETLIAAGKANLKRFSWDRSIEKFAKVLREIA